LIVAQGLVTDGFGVHVAALGGCAALAGEFRAANVSVTHLDRRWLQDPVLCVRLKRLVARLRPDVIHCWGDLSAMYGRFVSRFRRAPRIVVGQYDIDPWKANWRWTLERRLARQGERLVVDSRVVRDWCVEHGMDADAITIIRPGVPPAPKSDMSRDELLRELRLPAKAKLIGVIGRLVPEKRVKDLIWAADLLRVLHDNLRLLVIGDGPLRSQLEQYARLASDLDHIQFLGERADVWRIMPHLDVLWNASENRRHSIAVLEAMAAGVPVIASDTPFNREFVVENETGYMIRLNTRAGRAERARHTDHILTDREIASRIGAASHQRIAKHFSAQRMVQDYVAAYADA